MLRFVSLVSLAACAVEIVLATPQAGPTTPPILICDGYMWGVIVQLLNDTPIPVYNQYVVTTACAGPAWVQSSTTATPPPSISPWGTKYDCQVPEVDEYYCGGTRIATCCGNPANAAT